MKISIKLHLFLSWLSLSFHTWGEPPCNNVNLLMVKNWGKIITQTKNWNSIYRQIPLYDQGETGICYAFAAVQMVDYYRETKGLRITKNLALSSPVYTALLTKNLEMKGDDEDESYEAKYGASLDGGYITQAINGIRKYGMCREDVIKKSLKKFAKKENKDKTIEPLEFLEVVEAMFAVFPHPGRIKYMKKETIDRKINEFVKIEGRKINRKGKLRRILTRLKPYLLDGRLVDFMNRVFKTCRKKESIYLATKKIPIPKDFLLEKKKDRKKAKELLRSLLSRDKPQIIGIGYCGTFLEKKNYFGIKRRGINLADKRDCGSHASVLVGMRKKGNICQYLIRNSYGDSCKNYVWDCRYNADGKAVGIWVDESAFIKNLLDFTWFE